MRCPWGTHARTHSYNMAEGVVRGQLLHQHLPRLPSHNACELPVVMAMGEDDIGDDYCGDRNDNQHASMDDLVW